MAVEHSQAELITKIRDFIIRIGAEEAILFGSRALGMALEDSDVDLVIISDSFATMAFPRRLIAISSQWTEPYFLEALPYTREEFEKLTKTRGVVAEAVKTGIRIKAA